MTTTKQTLIAARALIEKPENWTQKAMARDAIGCKVNLSNPGAVCFCALGAIDKSAPFENLFLEAIRALKPYMGWAIETFNDRHTHAEVLEAFDKAIEAAE